MNRARLPRRTPPPLPWRRPQRELLLLALVAVAALTPVYPLNDGQDVSRVCLAEAVLHLRLSADRCLAAPLAVDRSRYGGHYYSDKAPGLSLLEVPSAAAVRLPAPAQLPNESLRLWAVRVLSTGIAFLVAAFLVGRLSEGLVPGLGAAALVTFALGTLVAPFAAANFDHVAAGTFGLGAFALAWRRRALLAGLVAGAGLVVEYEAAAILAILAIYVALQGGRALRGYLLGVLPGLALLGVYDWLAFGAPWRLSYHYLANEYATRQDAGLFGIHVPRLHSLYLVLVGNEGLVVSSPVVVAAAVGLVLLGRRHRAEALVCAAVAVAFFAIDAGYFAPYGGLSPGPRFTVPALPFLALGLAPAYASYRRLTGALAALSLIATTALTLTWTGLSDPRQTIWGEIARVVPQLDSSQLARNLEANVLTLAGPGRSAAAVVVACAAGAALVLALARPQR